VTRNDRPAIDQPAFDDRIVASRLDGWGGGISGDQEVGRFHQLARPMAAPWQRVGGRERGGEKATEEK
jgi:hypothetical protein